VDGEINVKPDILDFNEEDVPNCFVNEHGQLMISKAPYELLEQHSYLKDIEDIIRY
jgi:hypothetical protein